MILRTPDLQWNSVAVSENTANIRIEAWSKIIRDHCLPVFCLENDVINEIRESIGHSIGLSIASSFRRVVVGDKTLQSSFVPDVEITRRISSMVFFCIPVVNHFCISDRVMFFTEPPRWGFRFDIGSASWGGNRPRLYSDAALRLKTIGLTPNCVADLPTFLTQTREKPAPKDINES